MDVVSVMEFDTIPDGVIILDSYEMQIDQEIQHMQAGQQPNNGRDRCAKRDGLFFLISCNTIESMISYYYTYRYQKVTE